MIAPQRVSRRAFALSLDLALFIAFALLLSPRLTGLGWHEAIGISLCVPLLAHLLLSWPWIDATTRRALLGRDRRTRIN